MAVEIPLDNENENWLQEMRRRRTGQQEPARRRPLPPPPAPEPVLPNDDEA